MIVFDVETTGLTSRARAIEFACATFDADGHHEVSYQTLIRIDTSPGPTSLHGIETSALRLAPRFATIAQDLARLFRGRVPVAHNLRYDWAVLRREFALLGVNVPAHPSGVCTAKLARLALGGRGNLIEVCRKLGVTHPGPHRAAHDVTATIAVLQTLGAHVHHLPVPRPCAPFGGYWRLPRSEPPVPRHGVGPTDVDVVANR